MKLYFLYTFLSLYIYSFGQNDTISNSIIDGVYIREHKPEKSTKYFGLDAQVENIWNTFDTTYFSNGKIESITEYNSEFKKVGIYKEFDSNGIMIIEGRYADIDSAECFNCYNGQFSIDSLGKWYQITKIDVFEFKIGKWSTYHPNGKLASHGEFGNLYSAYMGTSDPTRKNKPINIYQHLEQLKTGIWKYYDTNGKLILTEEYHNGTLVFKINY